MPSRRYPTLVRSVAEHIAAVGRLPLVHALTISGPPPYGRCRIGRTGQGPALPHGSRAGGELHGPRVARRQYNSHAVDSDRSGSFARRCGSNLGAAARHPSAAVADRANPLRGRSPSSATIMDLERWSSAVCAARRWWAGWARRPPRDADRLPIGCRRVVRSKANAVSQVRGIDVSAYSSEKSVRSGVFVPVTTTM